MICYKCNQDSIKIKTGHIYCDICGLVIDIGISLVDKLYELFVYNENLENAEKLGHEAMLEGKELGDNPYSVANDQIILNKRWELGYKTERESYELAALSLSSEKIQNQLRTELRAAREEKEALEEKKELYFSQYMDLSVKIKDFCDIRSSRKYLFLRSFRRDLLRLVNNSDS